MVDLCKQEGMESSLSQAYRDAVTEVAAEMPCCQAEDEEADPLLEYCAWDYEALAGNFKAAKVRSSTRRRRRRTPV